VAELPATRQEEQYLNLECLFVFEGYEAHEGYEACEGCGTGGAGERKVGVAAGVGMTGDD
jgi:hypothetical protein